MEKKYFDHLNEGKKVTFKRRYTENHPAMTAGAFARVRNRMLEAIADGKISQEEFNTIISELSNDSGRWLKRNARYFNVSEDGISLSKFGMRILNQIKINENKMKNNLVFESFSDFVSYNESGVVKENQLITEGTRGQFGIIDKKGNIKSVYTHYDSYPEWMLPTIKKHYKNSKAIMQVVDKGGNSGLDAFDKMNFYNDGEHTTGKKSDIKSYISDVANSGWAEFVYLYDESDKKWYMADTSSDRALKPAFESVEVEEVEEGNAFGDAVRKAKEAGEKEFEFEGETYKVEETLNFFSDVNERFLVVEAFKSSKLQNLMNMGQSGSDTYGGKAQQLAAAIYGTSKIKLDQVEDSALIDMDPNTAYKQYANNKDYIVFYIVDNEKENPYADQNSYRKPILKPGILALTRAKDFLGVNYYSTKGYGKNRTPEYTLSGKSNSIGGNKNYRGYDASGISSIKRAAELADRAIAFNLVTGGESSRDLIQSRSNAKAGAIAFTSAKDFKNANIQRYREILATKAAALPLDKMVEEAIGELTTHIADAIKKGEKTKYNEIKIGEDSRGREIKVTDASNIMGNLLSDYQRYVGYMNDAAREKAEGYSSGYYEKSAKEYAKSISDKVKKIKDMDYAWY